MHRHSWKTRCVALFLSSSSVAVGAGSVGVSSVDSSTAVCLVARPQQVAEVAVPALEANAQAQLEERVRGKVVLIFVVSFFLLGSVDNKTVSSTVCLVARPQRIAEVAVPALEVHAQAQLEDKVCGIQTPCFPFSPCCGVLSCCLVPTKA